MMLSSETLESQFGNTEIDVLYQQGNNRIIQTKTMPGKKILELSWVVFDSRGVKEYPRVHEDVMSGISMGKAFSRAGIPFIRKSKTMGRLFLPDSHSIRFESDLLATVIDVDIFIGDQQTFYCSILETYSPDVKWPGPYHGFKRPSQAKIKEFDRLLGTIPVH